MQHISEIRRFLIQLFFSLKAGIEIDIRVNKFTIMVPIGGLVDNRSTDYKTNRSFGNGE